MQPPVPDDERPVAESGQPASEDADLQPDDERPVIDRDDPTVVPDDERPVPPTATEDDDEGP